MSFSQSQWYQLRAADVTVADSPAYATTPISATLPANSLHVHGLHSVNYRFYGTDANNEAVAYSLFAISYSGGGAATDSSRSFDSAPTYIIQGICTGVITLGQATGVVNTLVGATSYFLADTVTIVSATGDTAYDHDYGYTGASIADVTTSTDVWGSLTCLIPPGYQWLKLEFTTMTSAASINGLYQLVTKLPGC